MDASRWYFRLLGGFEARRGTLRIARFRTVKDLSLLGYLITHPPHRFTRANLARLLWEESPPERARNNLSVSLNALRRAFENADERELIYADAQQIGLNPDRFRADVLEFERAMQAARVSPAPAAQYEDYARTIRCYPGEFLPSVYDAWAIEQAAILQAKRLHALECLIERATEQGDLQAAQEWLALRENLGLCEEVPAAHPPCRAERVGKASSIPTPSSRIIGRDAEITHLMELLSQARCVTIHGLGGFGKTRLALEVAHLLQAQGATTYWIELAALNDARQLIPSVAQALNLPPTPNPLERLQRYCAQYRPLLFLDNMEHLLPSGATAVAELLDAVPDARICVTSRLPLQIEGETLFPLAPLACTPAPDNAAMTVFVERARERDACFRLTEANRPLIHVLCEQLDGIPLALELAAARIGALSLQQMLARVHQRMEWLRARQPTLELRHRAMQTVLDSAIAALTRPAQRAFAQLSILPDGWDIETAAAATDFSPEPLQAILSSLCEASLITLTRETPPRYRMLEIVREYGQARLSDRQRRGVESRLCDWTLRTALQRVHDAYTAHLPEWLAFWDERSPLLLLTLDILERRGNWREAMRLLRATERYFYLRPLHEDALYRLNRWLEAGVLSPYDATEARLIMMRLLFETQQFHRAAPIARTLAQLDRRDRRRNWSLYWNAQIAFILRDMPNVQRHWRQLRKRAARIQDPQLRHAFHYLHGYLETPENPIEWREAGALFARATGDPLLLQHALDALVEQLLFFGEYARALQVIEEAEKVCTTLGDWLHWNRLQHARAQCHLQRGEYEQAQQVLDACAQQERQRGQSLHTTRWIEAQLMRWQGAPEQAIAQALSAVDALKEHQHWHSAAMMLELAALCAGDLERWSDALRYCEQATRLRAHEDDPVRACFNRTIEAYCRARWGDANAISTLESCRRFWTERGWRPWLANTLFYVAEACADYGDYPRASTALQEAIALNEAMGRTPALQKCRNRLSELPTLNLNELCKTP